jgi:hypothetical protein
MRSADELRLVDGLIAAGINDCEIARRTGIPRRTVCDWRRGRRPRFDKYRAVDIGGDPTIDPSGERAYAYLLGLYLGDGHITQMPRTYRLRITLDGLYAGIVRECKSAIETLLPNRVSICRTQSRAVVVNAYSNTWQQLFPQHGAGPKHLRTIGLSPWQRRITQRCPEQLLRGLIHSDGNRHMNRIRHPSKTYAYPRYTFSNRSDDIRAIFCEHLDLLDIPWRRMNRWNISVARREAVARLDEFVGPKR